MSKTTKSTTTGDTPPAAETESFSASMEELTEIVRRIEDEQTDIDELASALARASELLERCRSKIRQVDLEVSQIVQRLDSSPGEADDPDPDPDPDGAATADD